MTPPKRGNTLILWSAVALTLAPSLAGCSRSTTATAAQQASVPGYRTVRDIRLPGDTSRWDYQAYDPASRRLYISHLGASQIVVFDTAQQRVAGIVTGIADVHGLALAPDLGRLFASATGQNRLVAIDLSTLKVVGSAPTGSYPDGVTYAPALGAVFVSNEQGSGITAFDARSSQRLGDVELGGDIGNSQYDGARKLVYVAVGSANELAVVDPAQRTIVDRYPLEGCTGAHGVQIDAAARHRVFVACEGNARMVAVDLVAGRVTQTFDVGQTPDVLTEDEAGHRLYVAAERGQFAVFDVSGDSISKLGQGNAGRPQRRRRPVQPSGVSATHQRWRASGSSRAPAAVARCRQSGATERRAACPQSRTHWGLR